MESIRIVTERLRLDPLRLRDAEPFFHNRSDPAVARYQMWRPVSIEEVREFITQQQALVPGTPGAWFQLGIRLLASEALIGDAGVHLPTGQERQAEIGVTIAPEFQGKGFATEAVRALLSHLFEALRMHRVYASVDPRNLPSLRLMERIGMRREAHFRESLWFRGAWVDDLVFALLESEWNKPGA